MPLAGDSAVLRQVVRNSCKEMSCFGACFSISPSQSNSEKRTSAKEDKAKDDASSSNAEDIVETDVESRDQVCS